MSFCESHQTVERKQDLMLEKIDILQSKFDVFDKNISLKITELDYGRRENKNTIQRESERTTKHKEEVLSLIKTITERANKFDKLLYEGNGIPAIIPTIKTFHDFITNSRKTYISWTTWIFRTFLGVVILWIAAMLKEVIIKLH